MSVLNSFQINTYFLIDQVTKVSYIDVLIINSGITKSISDLKLYSSFLNDVSILNSITSLPISQIIQSDYQDIKTVILLSSPELIMSINDYILLYVKPFSINTSPASVFDSYMINFADLNNYLNYFLFFFIYVWVVVYISLTGTIRSNKSNLNPQITKLVLYVNSISKEIRIQFEVVLQTIVFLVVY